MILLTGATGQVGTALAPLLRHRGDVTAPATQEFDLAQVGQLPRRLEQVAPSVIVNCGAWTDVDGAETHEDTATTINGEAVAVMAEWAAANGAWLVTLSTDYVLDGNPGRPLFEDHPPSPVNAYGRSKLVGERAALTSGAALVVRTSWVVSDSHPNFVRTILTLLARGQDPTVVDDQHGRPTVAADLAAGLVELLGTRPTGLLHLANRGATTWWSLARAVAEMAGHDPERVRGCSTAEYPTPARRPAWSVLGSRRRDDLGVSPLPHWRQSLPRVVKAQVAGLDT